MLRFFSIVICSVLVSGTAYAQHDVRLFAAPSWWGPNRAAIHFRNQFPAGQYEVRGPAGLYYSGEGVSGNQYSVENASAHAYLATNGETTGAWRRLDITDGSTNPFTGVAWTNWQGNTNYFPLPEVETLEFEWNFPAKWGGVNVEVKDADGNVLGAWIVPEEGGTIIGSVSAPESVLNGASVYLDGYPANALAIASATSDATNGFERGGYAILFDGSYTDGEWQLLRNDGSIAASGSSGAQTIMEGNITLGYGESAEFYTRTPAGDGVGSVWTPTGVVVEGEGTTFHSFVNNPEYPSPSPVPTPAPVSSPIAVPQAPTNSTGTPGAVTNPTNTEENVTVDVGSVELPGTDDGEEEVMNAIGDIRQLMQGIVGDMAQVQGNLVSASEEFNGLRLGGVGRTCSFQMGPASINLQTSGPIRTGLTLLVIGIAGFVAASMLRNAVQ